MARPIGIEARRGPSTSVAVTAALIAAAAAGAGAPSLVQAQQPEESSSEELQCLALAMYFEARSEGAEGMRAVGSVVLNRVGSDEFPSTPCEVVRDGGETPPCQFSWWCDGKSDVPRDREQWEIALALAAEMLEDRGDDPTNGALFFHSAQIAVPWRIERTRTAEILGHVYYR